MANTHVRLLNGFVMDLKTTSLVFKDGEGEEEVTCTLTFTLNNDGVQKVTSIPDFDEDRDGDIFLELNQPINKGISAGYMTGSNSSSLVLHLPISVQGIKRDLSFRKKIERERK